MCFFNSFSNLAKCFFPFLIFTELAELQTTLAQETLVEFGAVVFLHIRCLPVPYWVLVSLLTSATIEDLQ